MGMTVNKEDTVLMQEVTMISLVQRENLKRKLLRDLNLQWVQEEKSLLGELKL